MSQKNGDKSRFQVNRKRGVLRRAKVRVLISEGPGEKRPAHAKRRASKTA